MQCCRFADPGPWAVLGPIPPDRSLRRIASCCTAPGMTPNTLRCAASGCSGYLTPDFERTCRAASANWGRVLQAALGPQLIAAARQLERRVRADIAVVDLAIIADLLDDVDDPVIADAEALAELTFDAEHALHLRIRRFHHLVDIPRSHAVLLGVEHGEMHPTHDRRPLAVALAHHRGQGLLRDDLGQDDVGVGVLELLAEESEA